MCHRCTYIPQLFFLYKYSFLLFQALSVFFCSCPCFSLSPICITHVICCLQSPFLNSPLILFPHRLIFIWTSLCFITLSLNHFCLYSSKYPDHPCLYPSAPSSLSLFPSYFGVLNFLTTVTPFHYLAIVFLFWLAIFPSLHSFISALLALMSVAMTRSIQDGVFVLSSERKMNVAAMHHSPPVSVRVWVCVISVWLACVLVYSSPCPHLGGLSSLKKIQGVVSSLCG